MKKIIITTIALAFSICAFAKDLNQLVAEIPKGILTNAERDARIEYVEANKADFIRELRAYCASELATKKYSELTDAEKVIRETLAPAYYVYDRELDIADIVGIRFAAVLWWQLNGEDGYKKIKADNWIVDGIELSAPEKRSLAFIANDFDAIYSFGVVGMNKTALIAYAPKIKKLLLSADDQVKAKKFCREYQCAMLTAGVSDSSDEFKALKAVEDYLNRGILFK